MTKTSHALARTLLHTSHTVHMRSGEGLWQAKRRWERETGRRGLVVIR